MSALLLTVRGPEREVDLAVPADTPVAQLLPALLAAAVGGRAGGQAEWELALPGRPAFADDLTLGEHGVVDGGVLLLRERSGGYIEAARPQVQGGEQDLLPLDRTKVMLPVRPSAAARIRSAVRLGRLDGAATSRPGAIESEADYLRALDDRLTLPRIDGNVTIALVSASGGSGTSTLTTLLGSLLAALRGDRVIAAEAGELDAVAADGASDGDRRDVGLRRSVDGLLALDGPRLPAHAELGREEYIAAVERVRGLCDLLLLDCGALDTPATRASVEAADQVILVCDAEVAGAADRSAPAAALMGDARCFAVVNRQLRVGARVDLDLLQRRLPRARGLVAVHRDRVLAKRLRGRRFSWIDPPPGGTWPRSLRELAVLLVSDWRGLGLAAERDHTRLEDPACSIA